MRPQAEILHEARAYHCYSCGKCTAVCPVAQVDETFSPRRTVERGLAGADLYREELVWSCVTCRACLQVCPENVDFPGFIRGLRHEMLAAGRGPEVTHGGMLQAIPRLLAKGTLVPKRLDWVDPGTVSADSKVALFLGCGPYLETVFGYLGGGHVEIARSAIAILNHLGIKPRLLDAEACCGHDMLWIGDTETFEQLRARNEKTLTSAGVQKIVFTCPECYATLKERYKLPGVELVHLSELVAGALGNGGLKFAPAEGRVTYQDPCRLSRYLGVTQPPRDVLDAIPGLQRAEMGHSGGMARCCGISAWIQCNAIAKQMQLSRVREASGVADTIVTNCPKCLVHFKCVLKEEGKEIPLKVEDWTVLVARSLKGGETHA